ncbi:transcriptional regulator [Paenibacillus odorifer]|uniref:Transcriptional regulator n=1 Tax=Paenibacillus odorifer TaxID=189426 RepID=A0ABX3H0I1_9BACL|nr:helix-turn-helix domain-containing protein [Paenibacillus odorifer]OMC70059.1 transcriptional regulator [Paenibacillus odorifer]OMC80743.1 transcriptional regulator [Paenibacillus odorifer]OMD40572.1 transcriptional regulator [Paenibacillus odorifer]OMD84019.1 transcriptional regulator [Paenibacillus odorifer]OMD96719.1 transcriptional regulator [Paenibacillus odorifer]
MDYEFEACRVIPVLEIITGKWKPLILRHLIKGGTKRFSELRSLMPEITQRMLTLHLRELEEQHIVKRNVYAQVPPKVEYSITEHGLTLEPVLAVMNEWGTKHLQFMQEMELEKRAEENEILNFD